MSDPSPDVTEFPIPVKRFTAQLAGTPDAVWAKLLELSFSGENHTLSVWREKLIDLKSSPVS